MKKSFTWFKSFIPLVVFPLKATLLRSLAASLPLLTILPILPISIHAGEAMTDGVLPGTECVAQSDFPAADLRGFGHLEAKMKLRGYGKVAAEFNNGCAEFKCSSEAMAARLFSKYRKDIFQSGTDVPAAETISGIPVWRFSNGTYGIAGVNGNSVIVLGAKDRPAMETLLKKYKLGFPQSGHPAYLDYYDHNAFCFYVRGMRTYGESLDEHWPFIERLRLGGIAVQEPSLGDSPAEGVMPFNKVDYEMREAEKNNGMVVLGPCFGGGLPLWMANKNPARIAGIQDAMLYSGWTAGVHAAAFESSALWEVESSPIIAMQRQIMKRYTDSPALGGWHLNRGQPIGDMLGVANGGCLWDSSEAGRKAYVDYLKGKYTLPELGERWFGDKERFKSWSGVIPMEVSALLGGAYEKDRLVLSDKSWQWQKCSKDSWEKPPLPDSPWVDIAMPPSQRCTLLDSGSAYYKVTFQGDDFLKKHSSAGLYLKMLLSTYDSNKTNVWVNGQKLNTAPHYSSGVKLAQVEVPAGMLRADGNNEIIIQTPDGRSDGRIHGTVSLSPLTAKNYPFNDAGLNAQYVDSINFQAIAMASRVEQTIKYARQFDPDRPMVISGGSWDTPCLLMPIMAKYGVGHQYTAAEGFFNAQYPGIAGSFDYYFSAESSGAVLDAEKFDRMLGMMFYQGASSFDMFHNIGQYLDFDKKTGYMTATAPLLHLFGKYLTEPTNMAIFWSSTIPQCENVWNWNLGRGEIQSSHYATDYLNEQALEAGKGTKYDVLFDCGNEVLTEKAISLLKKYIEDGGTYVVLPPTGRDGQLRKDTQPVRELSGFQGSAPGKTGNIRFSKDPSIFKCWADQTFKGDGKASDWKDIPVVSRQSIELKPISQDTEILASWESGGAAIGLRKLGKGRVITLGSTFWRDGRDINGKWLPSRKNELFSALLKELGAIQDTDADSEKIWLRNSITKNGLEHWLIASNIAETVPYEITSDLEFQLDFKPEQVTDRVSGKAVAFTVDANNRVHLPKVEFNKYQTRIFSVSIPQDLSVTAKTWWREKTKYWRVAPDETLPLPEDHSPAAIDLSSWSFLPDKDGRLAGNEQWKETGFDDSGWRQIKSGSWKLSEPDLKDYNGTGLYRFKFVIPESWNGHRVTLNYLSPAAYDQAEFFLNGKAVAKSDVKTFLGELSGSENIDISEVVKRGKDNILAVKVTVSNKTANLAGICNMVWLAKEQSLDPVIDLNGKWEVIMGDQFTLKNAEVPGKSTCRYIRRSFNVPNDWKGKTVYLHLESPYNNIGAIVINDKVRAEGQGFQSFPTRAEINISDMIIPGQNNKIEIWHRHTVPVNWRGIDWKWPKEASLAVSNVAIGCITEDKNK